jgi:tetratricopeptide (TPR) repeat protein
MKRFLLPCLLLASPLHAQEQAPPADQEAPIQADLLPNQKAFLNLPEEERTEFARHFGDASRFFQQKRIFECLDAVSEAEAIFPHSAELLNLRGSCYVEIRAFDKAMVAFNEALKLSPKNTSIRFNVGEVLFVTRQWQQSHDIFQEVLREIPINNTALSRLVEFKLLLCKMRLGQDNEVIILAEKYDFQDDSPYHYYAKAALAYEKKELLEAEEWLGRANRIFQDPNIIAPWQDTLVEFGYIKSFYGEEDAAAVEP